MSGGHTPGPLWVEGSVYEGYAAAVVGRVEVSGHADKETRTLAHVRRLPDALAFAAAPDLLEALQEIVSYSGGAESALHDEYVMERVAAAIAKASGK